MTSITNEEIVELVKELREEISIVFGPDHFGMTKEGIKKAFDWRKRAADALESLSREREWLPIETAPKDGMEILTYCDFDGAKHQLVVSYETNPEWPWWDWDCKGIHEGVPTHWRLLPPPPKIKETKDLTGKDSE